MGAGQVDQLLPGLRLDVGGVDDRQPTGREPLAGDVVEHVEGVAGGGLVVGVVRDQTAAGVGGQHLGRPEVPGGEAGLAGAGGADEHDQGEVGHGELALAAARVVVAHRVAPAEVSLLVLVLVLVPRVKAASWVGGPTSGSSGPTGAKATV